jgi:hypothetical protein
VVVVLALLGTTVVVLANHVIGGFFCASPPGEREKARQESFVRAHVADARHLEWTVMDCDDQGQAYLDFMTTLTPRAAGEAFRKDAACSRSTEPDAEPDDVTCTSNGVRVSIYFEPREDTQTDGELYPQP